MKLLRPMGLNWFSKEKRQWKPPQAFNCWTETLFIYLSVFAWTQYFISAEEKLRSLLRFSLFYIPPSLPLFLWLTLYYLFLFLSVYLWLMPSFYFSVSFPFSPPLHFFFASVLWPPLSLSLCVTVSRLLRLRERLQRGRGITNRIINAR